MTESIRQQGGQLNREIQVVELCKASYAQDILSTNPEVSTLMPCAWGVYKDESGRVMISGMNMGLMGRLFGGNIARVISGQVAVDESAILAHVIQ
jgi:hypothetical protein